MASLIRGDWTHRRGDPGGARAVSAEIDKPHPAIAWSWAPEHGGRLDQVRIAGEYVVVATMASGDPAAPDWTHAIVYVLDATTGMEVARRVLPDPMPVAALIVAAGEVHVVATRRGEPIFWYILSNPDLTPRHRRVVVTTGDIEHDDVLDAWAVPTGDLWLEIYAVAGDEQRHVFACVHAATIAKSPATCGYEETPAVECTAVARDACAEGDELFAPVEGRWLGTQPSVPPSLARLDPRQGVPPSSAQNLCWARATVVGPGAHLHAVAGAGVVYAVVAAEDPERPQRARIEAFGIDRTSGVVLWRALSDRVALRPPMGTHARVARRSNGEILFQGLGLDGAPSTPLVCARPDGRLDTILLGARGRYVLDAALGDTVLVHRENKDGSVQVGGFAVHNEGRLLGRRAVEAWAIDAGDLGGGTTVYAGGGAVMVRGARGLCAVRL
jgi:hypothetical protein